MGKKNPIPDRWKSYCNIGTRIPGTPFVCFKVPLREELCRRLPDKAMWFTPENMFYEACRQNLKMALVIDLTNTDRYYDYNDITYTGTYYKKIYVMGHEVPSMNVVHQFSSAVDEFEQFASVDPGGPIPVVGVHCTHGVNRTGFLVCRYLIERKGWSASKAIHEFNYARGHQIERKNYLEALLDIERKCAINKYANVDKPLSRPRRPPSGASSSSSSSCASANHIAKTKGSKQQAPAASATANVQNAMSFDGTTANWQLFQQMMFSMAQMQSMMQMPMASGSGASAAAVSGRDEEEEEEENSDEDEDEEEEEDEDEDGEDSNGKASTSASGREGWELGGKVEPKPKPTSTQKRRLRRKNLNEQYRKMRRGKFWEIREMQKEKYGS